MEKSIKENSLSAVFTTPMKKEVINEEFELRDRPASEISHWWKSLTLCSYFTICVSGIASSISIGDLLAAFENKCMYYAKLTLKNLNKLEGRRNLTEDNIIVEWGDRYDCHYCEYFSASSVVFGGILFVLFLQNGRGGVTKRGGTIAWAIVPLALLIDLIFFIMSAVAFAKTIGGLSFFCTYALKHIETIDSNITSCGDILSFRYPGDIYDTNLYLDFLIAQIAISFHFVGWFISLAVILLRCLLGVDFVVYQRKQYGIVTSKESVSDKGDIYAKNSNDDSDFSSSTNDESDEDETTSFISLEIVESGKKKLV